MSTRRARPATLAVLAAAGLWGQQAQAACTVLSAPPVSAQAMLLSAGRAAPASLRLEPLTLRLDVKCDSPGRFTLRVADPTGDRGDGVLLLQGAAGQWVRMVPRLRSVDGRPVVTPLSGAGGGFSEAAQPGHVYHFEIELSPAPAGGGTVRAGQFRGVARVMLEQ